MGVYDFSTELDQWSPQDVARSIVNNLFEQVECLDVPTRQALNDPADAYVTDLLERWLDAKLRAAVVALDPKVLVAGMTKAEAATWERVRMAASSYLRLTENEPHHGMEREEICHAFHVIQGWLAGRPFLRKINGDD